MIYTETSVTRYLEDWMAAHLGDHTSPEYRRYLELFQTYLDEKREEQREEHDNEGNFGMSSAAGCLRANALRRAGVKGRPETGSTRHTWEVGHLCEVMTLAVLAASGFKLRGTQVRCDFPPHLSWADGVIESGPVPLPYPLVLSVKSSSYKSSSFSRGKAMKRYGFPALPLDGVERAQPSWYVQLQLEMAALGLRHGLVVAVAKDMIKAFEGDPIMQESGSLSLYAEVIEAESWVAENVAAEHAYIQDKESSAVHPILTWVGRDRGPVRFPAPGDVVSGWGGPNQQATGTFNYCFGCQYGGTQHCKP